MYILKYHVKNKEVGMLLLECSPHKRTLLVSGNSNSKQFNLPHVLFTIKYLIKNGKFIYPGIYSSGLRVFGSKKPIESLDSIVSLLPVEIDFLGASCTEHKYDMKKFNDLNSLIKFVLNLWWNSRHNLRSSSYIHHESGMSDLSYIDSLERAKYYGYLTRCMINLPTEITKEIKFKNKIWNPNVQIKISR